MAIRPPPPGITESLVTQELLSHYASNIELVVFHEFGGYNKGEIISDPNLVTQILTGPNEHNVVKKNKESIAQE